MTTTMPAVEVSPQDVAILNLNMLMQIEGKYRKDLATYIGRKPQNLSRMMNGDSNWAINDMFKAAQFVGVTLDVLTDPSLTPAKAIAIISKYEDDYEGGSSVVDAINDSRIRRAWILTA